MCENNKKPYFAFNKITYQQAVSMLSNQQNFEKCCEEAQKYVDALSAEFEEFQTFMKSLTLNTNDNIVSQDFSMCARLPFHFGVPGWDFKV